jgi:cytochrome P450
VFTGSELWEPEVRENRHAFYARVREAGAPVLQLDPVTGERLWLLARHRDVLAGLKHPAIGHQLHRDVPAGEISRLEARQLINLDPPDHTRLRGLVSRAFTPRTVASLEPQIVAIVDGLLADARRRGVVDGVADLGEPMPVAVIAHLIGVPAADRARFRAWSGAIMSGWGREDAVLEFAAFVDALATRRRAVGEDDLISRLVALDELSRDDLVAMIQLLLIAGQETAVYVIVNGIRALLSHPDQWARLCADPGLAGDAVEEILRFDGPVEIAPPRFAFEPVRFGAGEIPAFEKVGLSVLGANRDPEVFDEPDVFDIRRADAGRHLAFGHGIHFCLGAALGRLEARIMFERLASQLPRLRFADVAPDGGWIAPHAGTLPLACV